MSATESKPNCASKDQDEFLLSIVIPVYNEESVIQEFYRRLKRVVQPITPNRQYVFVNDGSSDNTLKVLKGMQCDDDDIAIIDLSRNFGKEIGMTAGLDYASGDAAVIIDADLQDPPELIPNLIEKWHQGYDVVYAKRVTREGEGTLKRGTAFAFYRVIQQLSTVKIPEDTGDFRLLSRRAMESLKTLRERNRFMKGLYAWIGFPQVAIEYRRDARYAGSSKWNYWRLWNFAIEGITSFSTAPLKLASYIGILTAFSAFLYGAYMVLKKLFFGDPVAGFPTLVAVVTFLGGVQLLALGILGEYIGRMFDEVKQRPLYLVNEVLPNGGVRREVERAKSTIPDSEPPVST